MSKNSNNFFLVCRIFNRFESIDIVDRVTNAVIVMNSFIIIVIIIIVVVVMILSLISIIILTIFNIIQQMTG